MMPMGAVRSASLALGALLAACTAPAATPKPGGSLSLPGPVPGAAPHLKEESAASGFDHSYSGGHPFMVGGGVAVLIKQLRKEELAEPH